MDLENISKSGSLSEIDLFRLQPDHEKDFSSMPDMPLITTHSFFDQQPE